MRVAIYGRVSTAEQSTAMQLEEMRAFWQRREWQIVEEFTDTMTGSKESRPALNRLLADAKRQKFDVVLVYRYDRFARSLRQLVNALADLTPSESTSFLSMKVWTLRRPTAGLSSASLPRSPSLRESLSAAGYVQGCCSPGPW